METTPETKESGRPRCYGHPFRLQLVFFALLAVPNVLFVDPAVGPFLIILLYVPLYGVALLGLYVLGVLIRNWKVSCGILIFLFGVTLLGCLNTVGETREGTEIIYNSLTQAITIPFMAWYPGLLLVMLAHGLFGKAPSMRTYVVAVGSYILCSLCIIADEICLLAIPIMAGTILYLLKQKNEEV